jgi:adenylate cyclase
MKYLILVLTLLGITLAPLSAQQLPLEVRNAKTKSERMNAYFQLAKKTTDKAKAADYAHQASMLASELGEKRTESEAALLSANLYFGRRDLEKAKAQYRRAWDSARNYSHHDLAVEAMRQMAKIAQSQKNTTEAISWLEQAIKYQQDHATGRAVTGSDAVGNLSQEIVRLRQKNQELAQKIAQLTGQSANLETDVREVEALLKETQEKNQQVVTEKDQKIIQIAQQKQRADSLVRVQTRRVDTLTREQLEARLLLAEQGLDLAVQRQALDQAAQTQERSNYLRNLLGIAAISVLLLAGLYYTRYRAKRRMANQLTQKNILIEAEQKRSDELLLNILPPAIAKELKAKNKVAARRYEQATVMFIDFTGFTKISERLSPEALVEELDYCFSNFDHIISKYHIEKIKTVGDAYICASGLSDQNASASDMVRAALEIQDFLLHLKAERLSKGMPCFEARIGLHSGPVVAGVVGAKKFAYDIWGDTVNIAARMEEACEPGRVNVSESAYWSAKYDFEWQQRGKVAAKNKGMLDMYYVTGMKA